MKKFLLPLKIISVCALVFVFFIGAGSLSTTSAKNTNGSKFERQLLKKLDHLLELLSPSEALESVENTEGNQLNAFNTFYNPDCLTDYKSWPNSGEYDENSEWNMMFTKQAGQSPTTENYLDLNGDGLLDYLYIYNGHQFTAGPYSNGTYDYARHKHVCIYLNNGSGWSPAHRCVVTQGDKIPGYTNVYYPRFYGDCAQL